MGAGRRCRRLGSGFVKHCRGAWACSQPGDESTGRRTFGATHTFPKCERFLLGPSTRQKEAPSDPVSPVPDQRFGGRCRRVPTAVSWQRCRCLGTRSEPVRHRSVIRSSSVPAIPATAWGQQESSNHAWLCQRVGNRCSTVCARDTCRSTASRNERPTHEEK